MASRLCFLPCFASLEAVHRYIRWFTGLPQKNMKAARIALRMNWLWWQLRHLVWNCILNVSGFLRAWIFGTFSVSVYSALGAESLHPLSPVAFVLNYGPIDEKGEVDVRIVYDHRVLDGATVARALAVWEAELTGPIVSELLGNKIAPSSPRT